MLSMRSTMSTDTIKWPLSPHINSTSDHVVMGDWPGDWVGSQSNNVCIKRLTNQIIRHCENVTSCNERSQLSICQKQPQHYFEGLDLLLTCLYKDQRVVSGGVSGTWTISILVGLIVSVYIHYSTRNDPYWIRTSHIAQINLYICITVSPISEGVCTIEQSCRDGHCMDDTQRERRHNYLCAFVRRYEPEYGHT
jgi:hypothetical protein